MILVGSDCHELGFSEDKRPEVFRVRNVLAFVINIHHMEARLVLVHRVENDLKAEAKQIFIIILYLMAGSRVNIMVIDIT